MLTDLRDPLSARLWPGLIYYLGLYVPTLTGGCDDTNSGLQVSLSTQTLCPVILKISRFFFSPVYGNLSKWLWVFLKKDWGCHYNVYLL